MNDESTVPQPTVEQLLHVAMKLEEYARLVYDGLAERFSHVPEVARFWRQYAAAEANHKKALEDLRASLSADRAQRAVDAKLLQSGRRLLAVSVEQLLEPVEDLDSAYELANELEASETNRIFEFLMRELIDQPHALDFLSADLETHVEHLWREFPKPYRTREERQQVKAHG